MKSCDTVIPTSFKVPFVVEIVEGGGTRSVIKIDPELVLYIVEKTASVYIADVSL
jgi:hypothetical protein